MSTRILVASVVAAFAASFCWGPPAGAAFLKQLRPGMPVYVTPFYDSTGVQVSVGEFSKKLASADAKTILDVCQELQKDRQKQRPEVLYVAAIRLYDLGHKDEAVYWYYTAQYRGRLFGSILDKAKVGSIGSEAFELKQAYHAFMELTGRYINGYAFGDLAKLEKTLLRVLEEGKSMPKFGELYPKVSFTPEDNWVEQNKVISKGLTKMIEDMKANADSIREERKKSGIEGKF